MQFSPRHSTRAAPDVVAIRTSQNAAVAQIFQHRPPTGHQIRRSRHARARCGNCRHCRTAMRTSDPEVSRLQRAIPPRRTAAIASQAHFSLRFPRVLQSSAWATLRARKPHRREQLLQTRTLAQIASKQCLTTVSDSTNPNIPDERCRPLDWRHLLKTKNFQRKILTGSAAGSKPH